MKQTVADKHYAALAYETCAPMYAELAGKKNASTETIRRAALSYLKLNLTKKSELYYARLAARADVQPLDYYNYAQILLSNGKYPEAEEMMKQFYRYSSVNTVARRYYKLSPTYDDDLRRDSLKYSIKPLEALNSPESEFAPAYFGKTGLVYASNKENHGAYNKQFAWDGSLFLDVYSARLDTQKQEAEKPERFDKMARTIYHDGPVCFNADNTMMILTRSNYYGDKLQKSTGNVVNVQLYYALRKGEGWDELKPFPYNNNDYSFGQACFAPDGKTVFFVSDMPGTYGNTDIWQTSYEQGTFTVPKNVGQEVNTEGREMFPFVDEDGYLVFSSDGHVGLGGLDVHIAKLMAGEPVYIANAGYPLNTRYDDFALVYDAKTLKGYFSSNREGGKGKDDLYALKLKEPFVKRKVLKGIALDERSRQAIASATVSLYDAGGKLLETVMTNEQGEFASLIPTDTDVSARVAKEGYAPGRSALIPYAAIPAEPVEVLLAKPGLRLEGLVLDKLTGQPLDSVRIRISGASGNASPDVLYSGKAGDFKLDLDSLPAKDLKLTCVYEKKGYASREVVLQKTKEELHNAPVIYISEKLERDLSVEGAGDPFAIGPVFFDLDKSDIRPDAAATLDKLAAILSAKPEMVIGISSGTDCRATGEYNMKLSERRALSTAAYLRGKGVAQKQLRLSWTGETALVTNCPCEPGNASACSEEQHQQNRRSGFRIISYGITVPLPKN